MKPVDYTGCKEIPHCGTTAIAILSEKPVAEVLDLVRERRGERQPPDKPVGGMEDYEIMGALQSIGLYPVSGFSTGRGTVRPAERFLEGMEEDPVPDNTLATFCRTHGADGPFLVFIDDPAFGSSLHAIVVSNGHIACSMTKGIGVPFSEYPYMESEVADFRKF